MAIDKENDGGGASSTTKSVSGSSTGTDVSLREYISELLSAEKRFDAERDRRYAEVALEREKALKIKEEADKAALGLAREIQTYKDEKANELREQINSERGLYASKDDVVATTEKFEALLRPLSEYVQAQRGPRALTPQTLLAVMVAIGVMAGIYFGLANRAATPTPTPSSLITPAK